MEEDKVIHAKWVSGECSNCKHNLFEIIDGDSCLDSYYEQYGTPYCPFCGAKMYEVGD